MASLSSKGVKSRSLSVLEPPKTLTSSKETSKTLMKKTASFSKGTKPTEESSKLVKKVVIPTKVVNTSSPKAKITIHTPTLTPKKKIVLPPVTNYEADEETENLNSEEEEMSFDEEEEEFEELIPIEEGEEESQFIIKGKKVILRTLVAPSTIPGAGMGIFAVDPIPKGASIQYKGLKKGEKTANHFYSWEVRTYDPETGKSDDKDVLYYIDASDVKYSNCTRTVNCGMTKSANNMDAIQRRGKFFYVALRNIKPGEELFVDYGEEYRTVNLKMRGKY